MPSELPAIGKISPEIFEEIIYPRLGAKSSPASPICTPEIGSTLPSRMWLHPPTVALANIAPRAMLKARWTGRAGMPE